MFNRFVQIIVLGCVFFLLAISSMSAADEKKSTDAKPAADLKETPVFQFVSYKESDKLHISGGGGGMTEKRHNFQIASKVVADGKNKSIVIVADSESKFGKDLAAMKPGDFFAAALQHVGSDPFDFATSLDPYILHPGEAKQNVFVFAESTTATKDGNDNMQVKLFKLGQFVTVNVPAVAKDRVGNKMPDPQIVKAVGKFAKGDSVEVTIQGGGPSPTIKTIELYCVPRDAVFSKLSESDVEGGKTPAIEVTIDGAATTILVPGKASPKGWVPDASLAAAIKKFKDGDKVVVRFLSDEGKNWLKEITKAPPEPAVKS